MTSAGRDEAMYLEDDLEAAKRIDALRRPA